MICARVKGLAGLFVEDDLSEWLARRMERHIVSCEECACLVREWRASQRDLKTLAVEPDSEEALTQIHGEVLAAIVRMPVHRRGRKQLALSAAVTAVLCAGLWIGIGDLKGKSTGQSASSDTPAVESLTPLDSAVPNVTEDTDPPVIVRWITDDPDIVIIWIGSEKERSDVLHTRQQNT